MASDWIAGGPRRRISKLTWAALGWAPALLTVLAVLAAGSALAGEAAYRSPHGFTVPIGPGYTRGEIGELGGLMTKDTPGFEAYFGREGTGEAETRARLVILYVPVDDWGPSGMAGNDAWIEELTKPKTARATVERQEVTRDLKSVPDRWETELVIRVPEGARGLSLIAARAGRDGLAIVLLTGLLSDEAALRREFALLRDGVVFDPALRYSQEAVDKSPKNLLVYAILVILVSGASYGLKVFWKRITSSGPPPGSRSRSARGRTSGGAPTPRSVRGSAAARRVDARPDPPDGIEEIEDDDAPPPPRPRPVPPRRPRVR